MKSIRGIFRNIAAQYKKVMVASLVTLLCLGGATLAQDLDGDGWSVADGDLFDEPSGLVPSPELVNPGAYDIPDNFIDDDCDGIIDNPAPLNCSTATDFNGPNGLELAKAMDICQLTPADPPLSQRTWGVLSAEVLRGEGTGIPPSPLQFAVVTGFGDSIVPRANGTMAVLSSGTARDANDPGYVSPDPGFEDPSNVTAPPTDFVAANGGNLFNVPGCPVPGSDLVYDSVLLRLVVRVPTNADGLSLDLMFLSAQFPENCSAYNDHVLALLYTGASVPADHNIVYDSLGYPITTQSAPYVICDPALSPDCVMGSSALAGTGFNPNDDAATDWFLNQNPDQVTPVVPGEEITLELYIFDVGDALFDSTVLLDNFHWRFIPQDGQSNELAITSVEDVPNDQGRQVRLTWNRIVFDQPDQAVAITGYEVFRRQDDPADKLLGWDYLGSVPAHGEEGYQIVAPTLCDSTVADGMCWSVFMVRAVSDDPFVFYDSPPDSGYSVDNLAPSAPTGLIVVDEVLSWDEPIDADFDYFSVYGSNSTELGPDAILIGYTTELSMPVSDVTQMYLLVTATDFAGNEGPATYAHHASGLPGVAEFDLALHENVPNPFNPQTTIAFEIPRQETVTLQVFDMSGRLVKSLITAEPHTPGRHEVVWNGRDDTGRQVASGTYFYRLEAGSYRETKRMTLVK